MLLRHFLKEIITNFSLDIFNRFLILEFGSPLKKKIGKILDFTFR